MRGSPPTVAVGFRAPKPTRDPPGTGARQSTEGSEILRDDTLQRGARTGDVDRVLVTRGKHYAGQLEDRCRRPGNVEIELVGSPRVRCGVEIQVRRCGIHGETGYLLAEIDEHIERGAGSGLIDNPHPCGSTWRRDIVVLQHQRGQCSSSPAPRDRRVALRPRGP